MKTKKDCWNDGTNMPRKKFRIKGLNFGRVSSKGKTYWRVSLPIEGSRNVEVIFSSTSRKEAAEFYEHKSMELTENGKSGAFSNEETRFIERLRLLHKQRTANNLEVVSLEDMLSLIKNFYIAKDDSSVFVIESLEMFLKEKSTTCRASTLSDYNTNFRFFREIVKENERVKSVDDCRAREIIRFIISRKTEENKGKELSGSCCKKVVRNVCAFWNWLVEGKMAVSNPFDKIEKSIKGINFEANEPNKILLSPDCLHNMLNWTLQHDIEFLPALALNALCGVRPFETARLKWADIIEVDFEGNPVEEPFINLENTNTKDKSNRETWLCPAAVAWLNLYRSRVSVSPSDFIIGKGKQDESEAASIQRHNYYQSYLKRLKKYVPLTFINPKNKQPIALATGWCPDCLRHNYSSYREALTNRTIAALEMGHSQKVHTRFYSSKVFKSEAERWFNSFPEIQTISLPYHLKCDTIAAAKNEIRKVC